mmetsp:Transcript_5794/g.17121  ORF Transcript_5794/g.17121 Transcript_5794/m.17121 type:complete len:223 (+) Transcript_5794:113-781(+)
MPRTSPRAAATPAAAQLPAPNASARVTAVPRARPARASTSPASESAKSEPYQKKSLDVVTTEPSTAVSAATKARAAAARSSPSRSSRNSFTGGQDLAPQLSAKWIRASNGRASVAAKVSRRASPAGKARASPAGPRRKSACSTSSSESSAPATSYTAPDAPEKKAPRASGASSGAPRTAVACSTMALYRLIQKASPTSGPTAGSAAAVRTKRAKTGDVLSAA